MMQTHELLRRYYDKKKDFAPAFSLRSLARRLEVSPSFLSRILNGQKAIPYPLLLRLGRALDIEPEVFGTLKEAHQVSADPSLLVPRKGKASVNTSLSDWELARPETFSVLKFWFYLPILEFTTLADYDGTPASVAKRLGLSLPIVEAAFRELREHKLLVMRGGKLVKSKHRTRWNSGRSLPEIRQFHEDLLERARRELRTATEPADFEKRLITGITLTASPADIARAKQRLAEALHEIANELTGSPGTEVYHLSAQLFPLTKG